MKNEGRRAIDWQEAYARLEQTGRARESGRQLSPEEITRILKARAEVLAKPFEEKADATEVLDLLVLSLAGEHYGIETAHVVEVLPLRELRFVPCTPSFVLGVVNHRGRILPVLDMRILLGLAHQGVGEGSQLVAVEAGGMRFGILAEAVAGTIRLGAEDVSPPPAGLARGGEAFSRGVTKEMVAVLDLEALARDPRIVVNEQVG